MREFINNIEHYEHLIAREKEGCTLKNINCYFMPSQIDTLIAKKQLSYLATDTVLCIFHDQGIYQRLYLFIDAGAAELDFPQFSETAVTDFPGVNGRLPEKSIKAIEALRKNGFILNDKTYRMVKPLESGEDIIVIPSDDITLYAATIEQRSQIYDVWRGAFDFATNLIPDEIDLIEHIKAGNVLCAFSGDSLIGVVQADIIGEDAFLRHLAVDINYRNKQIGNALRVAWLTLAQDRGAKRCLLWVSGDNEAALNSYTKRGYTFDGRYSEQYIINN